MSRNQVHTHLTDEEMEYFRACARIRGITVASLFRVLLKIVARDVLVASILDDDGRPPTQAIRREYGISMRNENIFDRPTCSGCEHWATGIRTTRDGVIVAACVRNWDPNSPPSTHDYRRGSDACGHWSRADK